MGNAKVKGAAVFSLPAGHSCPFAKTCHSKADRVTGKITDGPHNQFRCFATTPELLFKNVRESWWSNFDSLKAAKTTLGMASLIDQSLPQGVSRIRIHGSGDFFNQNYFDAWVMVAKQHPNLIFYGYTKALPLWSARIGTLPPNLHLVASVGGTHDHLIAPNNLRHA